ncbi:cytochrome oxidase assembly protein 1 [Polyrhizophydium stewartii]|uniref:Cytochrome oxidase assembly protein 1 n=1 Tax=Polyrhizophydium stewartii TaxID=2732419 RepID=A0ABR4MY09_9FUNG|nr:hypothetical protein HK105_006506 [Polyrhizophydium stewartii]
MAGAPNLITRVLRRPVVYLGLGGLGLGFWGYTIVNATNSNRSHNTIFRGIMFHLRHDPQASSVLGTNIHYDETKHRPVAGTFNNFRGVAEFEFTVEGDKAQGTVRFKGRRIPDSDCWVSQVFDLESGGTRIEFD